MENKVIDLTIPMDKSLIVYPGDPIFKCHRHTEYANSGCVVSRLEMGTHTGTHVDAPMHVLQGGQSILDIDVSVFMGEAIVLNVFKEAGQNIEEEDIPENKLFPGDIVLFRTGWEIQNGNDSFFKREWPGFTNGAVEKLIKQKVKAFGGDIPSIDSPANAKQGLSSHKIAAKAGLPVYEALINLKLLVDKRFFFIALPLKLFGGDGSPVRAVAVL